MDTGTAALAMLWFSGATVCAGALTGARISMVGGASKTDLVGIVLVSIWLWPLILAFGYGLSLTSGKK